MSRFTRIAILFTLTAAVASPANAQAADSLLPRSGTWGAEMTGLGTGGSLLRFTSPHTAWIAGLDISVSHQDQPGSGFDNGNSTNTSFVSARLGHRWYAGSSGNEITHLRTTYGLGLVGMTSRTKFNDVINNNQWAAGGYGELGATWFFTPHLSLGTVSQLQALTGRGRQTVSAIVNGQVTQETQTTNTWSISANLVRVSAAVYF